MLKCCLSCWRVSGQALQFPVAVTEGNVTLRHVILYRGGMYWNRLLLLTAPAPYSSPAPTFCCLTLPRLHRTGDGPSLTVNWFSSGSLQRSHQTEVTPGDDLKVKMTRFLPLKPWLLFWQYSLNEPDVFFTVEIALEEKNIFLILIKKIIGKIFKKKKSLQLCTDGF